MMCKHPYIKRGSQISRLEIYMDKDARLAATPFGCGQCLPCRINKAREWTNRILLEQAESEVTYFITLTYDDENLPVGKKLEKTHLQRFIKHLRRKLEPKKIRYFAVGEYGTKTWRPHYHIALFNMSILNDGLIEKIWKKGFVHIGELNKQSARYITGYVTKKLTKKGDERLKGLSPEFMVSSKRDGGIGYPAIKKIAESLKKSKYYNGELIKEINHGKNSLPLGRYLSKKLHELLEVKKGDLEVNFYNYQEEIFVKHLKKGEFYYGNIVNEKKSERLSQQKKHKIFKKRSVL